MEKTMITFYKGDGIKAITELGVFPFERGSSHQERVEFSKEKGIETWDYCSLRRYIKKVFKKGFKNELAIGCRNIEYIENVDDYWFGVDNYGKIYPRVVSSSYSFVDSEENRETLKNIQETGYSTTASSTMEVCGLCGGYKCKGFWGGEWEPKWCSCEEEHKEEPVSGKTPHRCPVCGSRGQVIASFYEYNIQTTTSNSTVCCRTCGGIGIVWG